MVCILVTHHISISAQVTMLKGIVKDTKNMSVPNARIALHLYKDSSVIQRTITDENGSFRFTALADNTYFISAASAGYYDKTSLKFSVVHGVIPFDTLKTIMTESAVVLNTVTVSSRKPLVENKPGKTVVNVDAFLNNTGSSLLEVLGNSPSVDVDITGTINIKGRSGALIYVDGKQNYLSGSALVNFLSTIPASQVDQIEIMSQPSARYDAAGNSGIINIKLKKNRLAGYTANVSASYMQGVYPRSSASAVLNYRFRYQANCMGMLSPHCCCCLSWRMLSSMVPANR